MQAHPGSFIVVVIPVVLPQLYHAYQKVVTRKVPLRSSLARQAWRARFATLDKVENGILVALGERDVVVPAPGCHEGLPGGIGVS